MRSLAIEAVLLDPPAEPQQRVTLLPGGNRAGGNQRRRMRQLHVEATAELDPTCDWIQSHHRARAPLPPRVFGLVPDSDLVLLPGVEVVAADVGLPLLPDLSRKSQAADRLALLDQLLVGQGAEAEVLPPLGLLFPAVPVEAVGEQVGSLLQRR